MKNKKQGFTLIELLVVIAIIGILASTVMVSLNTARGKAKDIRIKTDVKQIKSVIEANYNGVTYPDLTNDPAHIINHGIVDSGNPGEADLSVLLADIEEEGTELIVINEPNTEGEAVLSYAIYGQMVSTTTAYYCMDSEGKSSEIVNAVPADFDASCN